ncbi:hypothetical protein L1987_34961 [Smallanthus sonchifolius]|uniref:Uncharacterized protein n=1 Tax=Smallanthus sonchifolius TaxID=185202 RepID=A0ACB9HXW7_9ASTR|nr:hypothetical protein L1987_34961 [Smallanthus sonchifolius]
MFLYGMPVDVKIQHDTQFRKHELLTGAGSIGWMAERIPSACKSQFGILETWNLEFFLIICYPNSKGALVSKYSKWNASYQGEGRL